MLSSVLYLCSLSETTDVEGSAKVRWGDLNKYVLWSHSGSAVSLQGDISSFFNSSSALFAQSHFVFNLLNGYSQSFQPSWGKG